MEGFVRLPHQNHLPQKNIQIMSKKYFNAEFKRVVAQESLLADKYDQRLIDLEKHLMSISLAFMPIFMGLFGLTDLKATAKLHPVFATATVLFSATVPFIALLSGIYIDVNYLKKRMNVSGGIAEKIKSESYFSAVEYSRDANELASGESSGMPLLIASLALIVGVTSSLFLLFFEIYSN